MADVNPANDRRRLGVLIAILAVVVAVAAYRFLATGSMAGGETGSEGLEYTARNLPALEFGGAGSQVDDHNESAGNPFAYRPPPTATPNLTPPPTAAPRATLPPRPTPTPRIALGLDGRPKPPPPPFNREYIGFFGPEPLLVAAFRKGEAESADIEVVTVGEILDDIFILRAIGLESVTIGFVGYDPSEDTSVPLSDK